MQRAPFQWLPSWWGGHRLWWTGVTAQGRAWPTALGHSVTKSASSVPSEVLEIILAYPVSVARTVARERHGDFLARITWLFSSPVVPTEAIRTEQGRGAGGGGKPPSCSLPCRQGRNICLAKSHICNSSFVNTTISPYIPARDEWEKEKK